MIPELDIDYTYNESDGSLLLHDVPLVNQKTGKFEHIDIGLRRLSFRQKQQLVQFRDDEMFIYLTAQAMIYQWGDKTEVTVQELSSRSANGKVDRCEYAMEVINNAVETFLPPPRISFRERQ
ncbi:hypothetical protein [Moorena sp. SIO3A2]|uniref:hypothetical protein n=1 Tax=Moorena sp. SIO3A2 TaxID=2607841 RepID=UPI0013BDC71D|nr:hypothetical protein [Moorena sp. SIO3A2]NER90350.1 hypothetical protein [Moorena sp. SIO3A2]